MPLGGGGPSTSVSAGPGAGGELATSDSYASASPDAYGGFEETDPYATPDSAYEGYEGGLAGATPVTASGGPGAGGLGGGGGGVGGRPGVAGGMMPMGAGRGSGENEADRDTWLVEDDDPWGADTEAPPGVIR